MMKSTFMYQVTRKSRNVMQKELRGLSHLGSSCWPKSPELKVLCEYIVLCSTKIMYVVYTLYISICF